MNDEEDGQDTRDEDPHRETELIVGVVERVAENLHHHNDNQAHAQDTHDDRLDRVHHHPADHKAVENGVREQGTHQAPQGGEKELGGPHSREVAVRNFDQPVPLCQEDYEILQDRVDGDISANGDDNVLPHGQPFQPIALQPASLAV